MPTQYNAIGRRKTSTARVYLETGDGEITINGREAPDYFPQDARRRSVLMPFEVIDALGEYDVKINADGGGLTGQAEAAQLGIARALVKVDEEMKKPLREAGFLTRDDRMVERKKYGQPKARKKGQFSKR